MKLSDRIKDNKIFFITFSLLMITSAGFLIQKSNGNLVDTYYYPLYVINYDCGYSSRLLVGAVFSLFFKDTLNVSTLTSVLLVIYFILCFCLSAFINKYLKKTEFEAIGIYAVFLVISPAFLSILNYFGIIDMFWLFFVMGALSVINKKGWRWFIPVLCTVALAIHEVFVTTYLPVIAIAVLYQFIKKPNISNFVFISVCAVVVGTASVYFLIIGDGTMKMTSDEMIQFVRGRLGADGQSFDEYYLRSVFFWETPEVEDYHGLFGYFKYNFEYFVKNNTSAIRRICFLVFSNLLSSIPFFYLTVKSFIREKNIAKKFIYLCSVIIVPVLCVQLFISVDTERFAMHWLVAILFMLLFFVKEKSSSFVETYREIRSKLSGNEMSLVFFGIAVARIVLSGVRF